MLKNLTKNFVMAPAGDAGAGAGGDTVLGGGGNPPPNPGAGGDGGGGNKNAGAGNGGGSPPPQAITLPDNWIDTLPEDLKKEESLKQYKDFPTLVKTLIHAQKAIGADKIVKPSKHATEADWKEFYKQAGVIPESLEKYDVKVPEIFKNDTEAVGALKAAAFEANVSPKQLEKLMDVYGQGLQKTIESQKANVVQEQKKLLDGLKTEWGAAYDKKVLQAQAALKKFGDEGLTKILNATGLGNHPALIKAFAAMGGALSEDELAGYGAGGGDGQLTPAEAQKKYQEIMGNPQHPYNLNEHPNHKAAVQEVEGLFKMAFPS